MKRGPAIVRLNNAFNKAPEDGFWGNLCNWMNNGQVIPFISGSLFYDLIFNPNRNGCENGFEPGEDGDPESKPTIENTIAMSWAEALDYRLPDRHELARVAQYRRSNTNAPGNVKNEYLDFLKEMLLSYVVQQDPSRASEVQKLSQQLYTYSFSDLAARELGLLKFDSDENDPLRILARLPLPIYITTSHHEFLELALTALGKKPITQVCFWSSDAGQPPEYEPLNKLEASLDHPVVYHLFGLERYPFSMVLTEDDYLDFLVKITRTRELIPYHLRAPLSTSSLMLLGYRLQDWDFRTLFRGLITGQENHTAKYQSTIIQLSMENQYDHPENEEIHQFFGHVQKYLETYFNAMSFEIRWSDPACFLGELNQRWQRRNR